MGIPQGYVLDLVSKLERYTKTLFNATFGSGKKLWYLTKFHVNQVKCTLFESENDWQKIEQVPIPLPRASMNFTDVKTRNEKKKSIIALWR